MADKLNPRSLLITIESRAQSIGRTAREVCYRHLQLTARQAKTLDDIDAELERLRSRLEVIAEDVGVIPRAPRAGS